MGKDPIWETIKEHFKNMHINVSQEELLNIYIYFLKEKAQEKEA